MKKTFSQLLEEINACDRACEWVGGKTIEEAVAQCPRGDWMLWLAFDIKIDIRLITLAKARCAQTVVHLMEDDRSRIAVEIAESFGLGKATKEELGEACFNADQALESLQLDNSARYASTYTAYVAADTIYSHSAAERAAQAMFFATYEGVKKITVGDVEIAISNAHSAKVKNQLQTADICREVFGKELIQKVNELLNN